MLTRLTLQFELFCPVFGSCLELLGQLVSLSLGEGDVSGERNCMFCLWSIFKVGDYNIVNALEFISVVTLQVQLLCRLGILYWNKELSSCTTVVGEELNLSFFFSISCCYIYWKNYSSACHCKQVTNDIFTYLLEPFSFCQMITMFNFIVTMKYS